MRGWVMGGQLPLKAGIENWAIGHFTIITVYKSTLGKQTRKSYKAKPEVAIEMFSLAYAHISYSCNALHAVLIFDHFKWNNAAPYLNKGQKPFWLFMGGIRQHVRGSGKTD